MKQLLIIIFTLLSCTSFSQDKQVLYLWPGKVPGETKEKQKPVMDITGKDNVIRVIEITDPFIEIWPATPAKNNGCGIIICPGGAYKRLSYDKEGTEIAKWLNNLGFTSFVLMYRVPDKREGALQDAQRAMRIIRANSAIWKLNPDKIGIMGFSAGGSLSARTAILSNSTTYIPVDRYDSVSCRPTFAMLIYPAYLDLGENRSLTPELKITGNLPPFYIFQSADDSLYGNSSLVMATALRDAKSPVELHLVPTGGHGYGLRSGNPAAETWPPLAEKWLVNILSLK